MKVSILNKEDCWHVEAMANMKNEYPLPNGTYELVGPKINGNKENWDKHELIRHGVEKIYFPGGVTFETLKKFLNEVDYEGIVWHHPDGRMVKIKKKDFGFKR